jgi:hypothetical protein
MTTHSDDAELSAARFALEFELGFGNHDTLCRWAGGQIESGHLDSRLYDLMEYDTQRSTALLFELVNESENLAAEFKRALLQIVKEHARALLSGRTRPSDFCELISRLDCALITPEADLALCPYPGWLGDLYNACDWCDEHWTLSNHPHLGKILLRCKELQGLET